MVTIKDIANRLGVSVSTVSKGLNGASDISEDLRQIVLDTAVEMGYSTKRSKREENRRLCIFVENMVHESPGEFGYDLILGFRQNAFRYNWDVTVTPITPEFQEEEKYDTYLLKNGCRGAFLLGLTLQDAWMQQLEDTTMPSVLFDNFIASNPNVCYLGTDNYEGISMAVNHLYALGHRRIAFLNGPLYSMVSDQRQGAFETALWALGLPREDKLMARGYYAPECAAEYVPAFLEAGATAILCGSDMIAKWVMEECEAHGRKVPEDISVAGFDDIPLAATFSPPLTTVRQECNELGRCAYVILRSLIHHIPISKTLIRPTLIKRESTSRPAGNQT